MKGSGVSLVLGLVLGGGASLSAAPSVSSVSPFLPPDAPAVVPGTTGAQGAPIEFRGVVAMGGRQRFNFFDPARKQSAWVGLAEAGGPYRVTAYDEGRETVTVEVEGRVLSLALEKAKIGSAPPPANVPMVAGATAGAAAVATPSPGVAPIVLNPTPADEAKRLATIAAEVRRRRALRQQQPAAAPGPAAAMGSAEKAN
jgi:hypothetical protein